MMKVYRIIVDQDKKVPDRFTWIIKESVGERSSRTIDASMGSFAVGRLWVFPSAREAFDDALDVLCTITAKQEAA